MSNDAQFSVRLGDFVTVTSGYPLRVAADVLEPGDVHLVQLKHTSTESEIDWSVVPKVALPSKRNPVWLHDGDVVFAARGTRTLAYAIRNPPLKTVCAPQFFVLAIKDAGVCLPEFIAWQINQRPAQDHLKKNATGSHIQNIRREVLENLLITLPPMSEQHLVVEFWCAAQQERATLNRMIDNRSKQLEALALRLLQPSGEKHNEHTN